MIGVDIRVPADKRERVLFVDDEPRVLDGLRRMLRSMREVWDMTFVNSAREALDVLRADGATVLITDVQMPDMDGVDLLEVVTKESPATVRIVLSGHSDAEHLHRAMNLAHQYLTKPCSCDDLSHVIQRACALRNLLTDEDLRRAVSRMTTVPSPPAVYRELMRELEREECSLQRVGAILAGDIGMMARVFRFVNSAWFALNRSIKEPMDAVLILGTEAIKTLVLSSHVFGELENTGQSRLVAEISEHSLQVASLSKRIALAEHADATCASQAFAAGMMHEVGLMVLAVNEPAKVAEAFAMAQAENVSLLAAERRLFKATHAQIGGYLLGLWGMPNPIVEAVAFLGDPSASLQDSFAPLCAVHAAESLVHASSQLRVRAPQMDTNFLERLGVGQRVETWNNLHGQMASRGSNA